jgi:hypothetical protein
MKRFINPSETMTGRNGGSTVKTRFADAIFAAEDMDQNQDLPPKVERRPKSRKRVFLGATVVFTSANIVRHYDCAIRDISESGARIAVLNGQPVPSHLFLVVARDRVIHEARVVWNTGREAGLSFSRTLKLADLDAPALRHLRPFLL